MILNTRKYIGLLGFVMLISVSACKQNTADNNQENSKEQLAEYTEEIEKNPNDPAAYINRAKEFYKTNQLEPAIRDMEKAVSLDTTKGDNYFEITDSSFIGHNNEKEWQRPIKGFFKSKKSDSITFYDGFPIVFHVVDSTNSVYKVKLGDNCQYFSTLKNLNNFPLIYQHCREEGKRIARGVDCN